MNRLIQWFIENSVAANLLMVLIFVGAFFSAGSMDKEVFPGVSVDIVTISMSYPGAGPAEVEEQITIRIEEAIADLDGIHAISSRSQQGFARVTVEVTEGHDTQRLLNDIKTRVDAITAFPGHVERPIVQQRFSRSRLMFMALYGDVDERALKETAWNLRNELTLLSGVDHVELNGQRPYEMAIEVSEHTLRRHQLTFEQVAGAIRQSSLNLPAGAIRTREGDIQIQTRAQAYSEDDFGRIAVLTRADGSQLLLRDIATISDGFEDRDMHAQFNGKPAIVFDLYIGNNPDIVAASKEVQQYLEQTRELLPPGLQMDIWFDMADLYESRLNLLLINALTGLLLVFVVLMLFLRPLLALWVCVGIAIAFAGAVWLLPYTDISLNMVSLFAFLLVLGIVVDDAIIVGESIYTSQQHGMRGAAAAASGAKLVSTPVFFAVLSTMIFFVPMLVIPGQMGAASYPIAVVVIICLAFSLIECFLILPSHLSGMKPERESTLAPLRALTRARQKVSSSLTRFADKVYQPLLQRLLHFKLATVVGFVLAFALSVALYSSGWMKRSFWPQVPSDIVSVWIVLPEGTPFHETERIMRRVESAALALESDATLVEQDGNGFISGIQTWAWDVNVSVAIALHGAERRSVSSPAVSQRWRELIGEIPEALEYQLDFTINAPSDDIRLNLSIADNDLHAQEQAAQRVIAALGQYPNVYDLRHSLQAEREELEINLKPHAQTLGITLAEVATQVRQAFYGEEVQRIPRGTEDVRVLVRYPRSERQRLDQLEQMRVRNRDGVEIPLLDVAQVDFVPGFTVIERRDRKRNITITGNLREGGDANALVTDMEERHLAQWRQEFPGLTLAPDGVMRDQADFMTSLINNMLLAILVIYILMAMNFRSYWQPLLILTAIPFGFMGAVIGHLVMGREVSMMSMLGFIACAGVVVNDNLVLVDRINRLRKQGMAVAEAVVQAGRDRFRAIVLTSLTTFVGLLPIMFERSMQAQFLIPMVISLSFGVLFATFVTLLLVPTLYQVGAVLRHRQS